MNARMECHCISFTEIPRTSRLFQDFLYQFDRVASFYAWDHTQPDAFARAGEQVRFDDSTRQTLVEALERQNRAFGAGPETFENLARLRSGRAVAVVTGQQVGLLTGPAYSVYKALTAVRLAAELGARGLPAVPVFWLASEDHDIKEVNHTFLLDHGYNLRRLEHRANFPPNRRVGEVAFGAEASAVADGAREVLAAWPGGKVWAEAAAEACRPGESYSRSFGRLMARMFQGAGVVLVDPLDEDLHRLAAPVFARVIEEADKLEEALAARSEELERAGYHTQAKILEEGALFFVNVEGQRLAVRRRDASFWIRGGQRLHAADLLAWLARSPKDFTANVLLRPIVQDTLLPTLCYVGGPAEIAYLAESEVLYRRLLGRMPVIFPRASFTLVDARARRLMKKYSLNMAELFAGRQAVRDRMARAYVPKLVHRRLEQSRTRLEKLVADLKKPLEEFEPTLAGALENSARKMRYQLEKIRNKVARAEAARDAQFEEHRRVLENLLYPNRTLQERQLNFLPFLSRYGRGILDRMAEKVFAGRDHHVIDL